MATRAMEISDDIPRMRAALDNQRVHQRFQGLWTEIPEFSVSEMSVYVGGKVEPSDDPLRPGGVLRGGELAKVITAKGEVKAGDKNGCPRG